MCALLISARVAVLHTIDEYNYNQHYYRIGQQTSITFQVQACNDAHIVLFDHYQGLAAYEIVIGGHGNTLSFVRNARYSSNVVTVTMFLFFYLFLSMYCKLYSVSLFYLCIYRPTSCYEHLSSGAIQALFLSNSDANFQIIP